jgi:hypothetical protein
MRIMLIKSILMAMSIYFFLVLAIPLHIYQKLCIIQRNCLWGGTKRENKWVLITWEKMCEPKSLGNLGLKDPQKLGHNLEKKKIGYQSKSRRCSGKKFGRRNMLDTSLLKTASDWREIDQVR